MLNKRIPIREDSEGFRKLIYNKYDNIINSNNCKYNGFRYFEIEQHNYQSNKKFSYTLNTISLQFNNVIQIIVNTNDSYKDTIFESDNMVVNHTLMNDNLLIFNLPRRYYIKDINNEYIIRDFRNNNTISENIISMKPINNYVFASCYNYSYVEIYDTRLKNIHINTIYRSNKYTSFNFINNMVLLGTDSNSLSVIDMRKSDKDIFNYKNPNYTDTIGLEVDKLISGDVYLNLKNIGSNPIIEKVNYITNKITPINTNNLSPNNILNYNNALYFLDKSKKSNNEKCINYINIKDNNDINSLSIIDLDININTIMDYIIHNDYIYLLSDELFLIYHKL